MVVTTAVAETTKPHVAVLPSPGMGHITPLFEFSKRLVHHHGFRVTFLVITAEASAAQNQLLRSPSLSPDLHVVDIPPVDVSAFVSDDMPVLTHLCVIVEHNLKSLKSVLINIGLPKALVIDLFCTDAFEVSRELSIPTYSFFTASAALLSFSLYLPILDREVECEYSELPGPVRVPGCTPIRTVDLLDQVQNRKIDEYKWYLLHVSRLPMAAGIFVNSWEDLEPVSLQAIRENRFFKEIPTPPVHPIGPLIKQEELLTDGDVECLRWLDKQPVDSVLFISLGSGGTFSSEQLVEFAWGLAASQQRFLWVVRKPSNATASDAFFTVGCDLNDPKMYLPEGFVEKTREVGMVVPSWAPQVEVLRHRATGGFVSHCGWNSALESISHGVPVIAWPLYAEQRMNATILAAEVGVEAKAAAEEREKVVGRDETERVVRILMEGEEGKVMRQRVRELQSSAETALDRGGFSFQALSKVAGEWKGKSMI